MSQHSNQAPLSADADPVQGLGVVDRSVRFPVLVLMSLSLLWLLGATVLFVIASFKLHTPGFFSDWEWLTYGRVRPAATTAMIYGWAMNAGFALAVWMMARLSRAKLLHGGLIIVGALFWNIGVKAGIFGILIGKGMPYEWMALPAFSGLLLLVAYILMAVWVVNTFRYRQEKHVYVSQWFLLAALFSFPWVFSVAQIMLVQAPVRGTLQALVSVWYTQNLIGLWLMPIGLAAAYYFIPKVLGKPIHSYHLAVVGFWSLAVTWAGPSRLVGGPVPAWVISAGIVGCVLMLIPVIVTTVNLHLTSLGSFREIWNSPTLRFVVFGSIAFSLVGLLWAVTAFRSVAGIIHFTLVDEGLTQLAVYGFFSMTVFGGFYFIVPRLLEKEWPSASLISLHFWSAFIGVTILVIGLFIGGVVQGLWMNDPGTHPEWITIVESLVPYLLTGTVGWILILLGHLAFATSFVWMLIQPRTREATLPTLFAPAAALKSSAS
jgi:cytochrome c oxidase cbb3-type subunit 1